MLRKWAYWCGYIVCKEIPQKLADMGEQGWELCSMAEPGYENANGRDGRVYCYCVFKRPGQIINEVDAGRL